MTIGLIVGNRGFFPDHLAKSGREEMIAVLKKAGVEVVVLGPDDSKYGAVETRAEARACADLFRRHRDAIDGVVVTLPNFGDERGVAETLSKAKNTSVGGLEEAGVLVARAGKVRLFSRTELKGEWDPAQDKRPTAWEAVQYLIWELDTHGEQGAALLLSRLGAFGETARDLAYRLYTVCERKGWAQDALGYNMLVVAWPRLREMARGKAEATQGRLI